MPACLAPPCKARPLSLTDELNSKLRWQLLLPGCTELSRTSTMTCSLTSLKGLRFLPFCLKLVLKMDLIALHAPRSLRLLVCHQNLAELSRNMAAVFTDASSDVVRQAAPYPKSEFSTLSILGANECLWFRLIRTISVEPLRRH